MKIEKVNENQIRCTLTREDLANRELKISELAYGTEKAKNLFRDMMQQASIELGFEAEDIPLMIEAIPLNAECIVLVITKVEDPEELDTRFSRFAPSVHDGNISEVDVDDNGTDNTDDVLELFKKLHESRKAALSGKSLNTESESKKAKEAAPAAPVANAPAPNVNFTKLFAFDSLHTLIRIAHLLKNVYRSYSSLYKDDANNSYILVITKGEHTPEEYNRVCNALSEYGAPLRTLTASESVLEEHYDCIIADNALQSLASM